MPKSKQMPLLKEQTFNSSLGKNESILRLKRTQLTINFPINEEVPDDFCIGATEEIWDDLEERILLTTKVISEKLDAVKPQILHSLRTNTYLSPLHKKLATKAEKLKNLDSLNTYHPKLTLNIEVKQQIGLAVHQYDEFRRSKLGNYFAMDKRERDYPLQFYILLS